jgi:4-hydroxybenzoate polyprenyltransferase
MKKYLILIRPYGMLFLGFTPVFSAIANGEFSFQNLIVLLIIGLFTHIFSFVQNDYFDITVDKKSEYVSKRPIATGKITKRTGVTIYISSFIISIILAIVFVFSIYCIITLLLAFLFFSIYNRYSKQYFAMEYILAIGIFFFGLFGAYAVSEKISNLALIVSAVCFMQWLFSVGISANLKDVKYDTKLGIKTTPTKFGVRISDNKLVISPFFIFYAYLIKIIHTLIIFLPFILGYTPFFVYNLPIPALLVLTIAIILIFLTKGILSVTKEKREKMLIYVGLQEGLSILLLPSMLMTILIEKIGLIYTVLIFLLLIIWPLFWFRLLFGKKMIPLE